jgi:hypothetical protein
MGPICLQAEIKQTRESTTAGDDAALADYVKRKIEELQRHHNEPPQAIKWFSCKRFRT